MVGMERLLDLPSICFDDCSPATPSHTESVSTLMIALGAKIDHMSGLYQHAMLGKYHL